LHKKNEITRISQKQDQTTGFIALATILGAVICGFFVFQADFPVNDGGMFYSMVHDLEANAFKLPVFTSYNNANIPYAYPPFSFYLAGFLNAVLKIYLLQLLRFVPYFFTVLTIPAFYLLSTQLLKQKDEQVLATFFFTVLPPAYTWQIMGGGLTRAPAFFFSILALYFYIKYEKTKKRSSLIWMTLLTSLTALTHLEMLWMLGLSSLAVFIYFDHSLKGARDLVIVCGSVLLMTSLWWVTVVQNHGLQIFLTLLSTGSFTLTSSLAFILSLGNFGNLAFIAFLAILGIFMSASQKNWFLNIWLLAFVLFDPRSSQRSATLPIAMLAAVALVHFFNWVAENAPKKANSQIAAVPAPVFANPKVAVIFCAILFLAFFNNLSALYAGDTSLKVLNRQNREAMVWVEENTPEASKFLILDFPTGWHSDMIAEWFPALTGRTSLLTAQGLEWLPDQLRVTSHNLSEVLGCKMNGVDCLENWAQKNEVVFDYVYFSTNSQGFSQPGRYVSTIDAEMNQSSDYLLVFSNEDVRIFKNRTTRKK